MNRNDNSINNSLTDIIKILYKKRKTILYAGVIAFVGSILISLLLPNYYRAESVFFAANPSLGNPTSLTGDTKSVDQYGTNKDLDRLFSIAESKVLLNHLIEKFDLYNHYEIDSKSKKAHSKLTKEFLGNFTLLKTKYDAFSLSFEDKDIKFVAPIVNEATHKIDELSQSIIKSSQAQQISTYQKITSQQKINLSVVLDSLFNAKNKYRIFNVEAQEEAIAELSTQNSFAIQSYLTKLDYFSNERKVRDSIRKYQALLSTSKAQKSLIDNDLISFNRGSNIIRILEKEKRSITQQLNLSNERLKRLMITYETPFKGLHIVENGIEPDAKYRPKRAIYVIAITLLTLIFTVLSIIVLHTYKGTNWKEILSDD